MARRSVGSKAPSRLLGYCRVSTLEQASEGHSLAAQRERIEAWGRLHDVPVVGVIEDAGVSATTLDRPGLQEARARLRAGEADGLIVTKLDRLTRRVRHLGTLVEDHFRKAALVSVAESIDTRTAAGRLVLNVLGSVAEWEADAIAERTSEVLQSKKRRGERVGQVPYGFRVDPSDSKCLTPDMEQQATIDRIERMRGEGLSARRIAAQLTADTGRKWHANSIVRILASTYPRCQSLTSIEGMPPALAGTWLERK